MILWRISNYSDLTGIGGLKYAGRWHNRGLPILYLAEHPALALLEVLVHFELAPDQVPSQFKLLQVMAGQQVPVAKLDSDALSKGWQSDLARTRAIGDEWLDAARSLLLQVPSAVVPHSYNYLLNPRHPAAKQLDIINITRHPYDTRLFAYS
ncbi:MAG: RES family NAD+ phosphorylase [Parahaliea sp.]